MKTVAGTAVLVAASFLGHPLSAQEPDFSGTWVLDHERTELENMPDIVLEISQDADTLRYVHTSTGSAGESVTRMSLPRDGSRSCWQRTAACGWSMC